MFVACTAEPGGAPATSRHRCMNSQPPGVGAQQRPTPPTVDVVLPCLDEAGALPWVLTRMPPGYRAVVADNGSTDSSADVARAHGALVVDVPRRGFGAARHAGLLAATADVVCFMDADASLDPQDAWAHTAAPLLLVGMDPPSSLLRCSLRPSTSCCPLGRTRSSAWLPTGAGGRSASAGRTRHCCSPCPCRPPPPAPPSGRAWPTPGSPSPRFPC